MPEKAVVERARKKAREGKSPSTQAGEFVKAEIDKVRKGEHGVRSPKQAIAIGLSEARKAGVKLPPNPNKKAKTTRKTKRKASSETSAKRARASLKALKREPTSTVSPASMSKFSKQAAKKRGPAKRHKAAMKAVKTKGPQELKRAARKAAHTREMRAHH
ncbi:DUF6496 domain-containing protein [Bdellovibrio sp. HCB-162]|uniref:DUF6496 domain-containing protein n=1 Tax=Bdellovibrio sp. HCB-162 TaxID=3394234 RepID=UPI0039BD6D9B